MSYQIEPGSMTYETFFGLREKPFSLGADPRFLYLSRAHTKAYDKLLSSIRRREGLLVLTGDIGTGKTTLCRAALQSLDRKTFSAFVPDPFASREDLLKILLIDFGVTSIRELTTGPLKDASRTELSYLLSAFLDTLVPLEAFVVVIIDEAQNMAPSLIEEIRILSDSRGRHGQLQVVFVGQLELHDRLKLPEMRQVDQRVCMYSRLDPLDIDDVRGYVHYRLHVAGGSPDRIHFSPDSIELLHTASGGVPRLINRICDRALYAAYVERTTSVAAATVLAAIQEISPELADAVRLAAQRPRPSGATAHAIPHASGIARPVAGEPGSAAEMPSAVASSATLNGGGQADRVDDWLNGLDANPSSNENDVGPQGLERVVDTTPIRPARLDDTGDEWRAAIDDELRPETHLRRLRRRWFRRMRTAAVHLLLWSALFGGAVHGISTWTGADSSSDRVPPPHEGSSAPIGHPTSTSETGGQPPQSSGTKAAADLTESATDAVTPSATLYVIEVALYQTYGRAGQLLDGLAAQGLRGFQRPLTLRSGRTMQQVLVGPFTNEADAAANLERLQQTSGFEDARIVVLPPQ